MTKSERWTSSNRFPKKVTKERVAPSPLIDKELRAPMHAIPSSRARPSSRSVAFAVAILFSVLAASAVSILTTKDPLIASGLADTPHSPIVIDRNSDFAGQGWPGSGSDIDPYVMAHLEIDALGYQSAIYIANTTVHFKIESCVATNADASGIRLLNLTNGRIEDTSCTKSTVYGMLIDHSSSVTLVNNSCSANVVGIRLTDSSDLLLDRNNCSSNSGDGLQVYGCSGVSMTYGTCSGDLYGLHVVNSPGTRTENGNYSGNANCGILLTSSDSALIANNTCSDSGSSGIYIESSDGIAVLNNTLSRDFSYGFYAFDMQASTVSDNHCTKSYSGIYLLLSGGNQIINNTCGDSSTGIYVDRSNSNLVSGCQCIGNWFGIYVTRSNDLVIWNNTVSSGTLGGLSVILGLRNTVAYNLFSSNVGYGVDLDAQSVSNLLYNNTFDQNHGAGVTYDPAHVQASDQSGANYWNASGDPHGFGNYWTDWTSPDSTGDGIVDNPYVLDGGKGAQDLFPLTSSPPSPPEPIPEFPIFVVLLSLGSIFVLLRVRRSAA